MLSQAELKENLFYDPETGDFVWIKPRKGIRVGSRAGYISKALGYVFINFNQIEYGAHRLACLYMTGKFPMEEVDHEDRNRANNRWENLRQATSLQNKGNSGLTSTNTSGVRGVSFDKRLQKWHAYIGDPRINLGRFIDFQEAVRARRRAEIERYGEFAAKL